MSTPIEISEKSGVRYLHFGSDWVQGAMRIKQPWALELEYTREMMFALLLAPNKHWPKKILTIGLGAGSVSKFLYRHYPHAHQTVIEIAPGVVSAARQYFNLPDDDKQLHVIIADGAEHVINSDKNYDLILVDGFDQHASTGSLDSELFYQNCKAHLNERGIFTVNLLGRSKGFNESVARINRAFDNQVLTLAPCTSGNAITLAFKDELVTFDQIELKQRAHDLKDRTGLNLLPSLDRCAF